MTKSFKHKFDIRSSAPGKMKSIGGYLELQLSNESEYYPALLRLNTGRNALEYILKTKAYTLIYLPYFTCEVIMEPVRKLGIQYQFYTINEQMEPVLDFELGPNDCLLYTNYFGLKQETTIALRKRFANLIVDNSQGFFSEPVAATDTFYSCRKFFGVPDGAYLQVSGPARLKLERDVSVDRFSHLIRSIDLGIENGYSDYLANNNVLSGNPIRKMSVLTQSILSGVAYKACKYRRNANFMYLHDFLVNHNDYVFDASSVNGPMVYPFSHPSTSLREKLLEKRIYTATYWPNVFSWTTKKMYEYYLASHLIPLPIDHRYTHLDMKRIINVLKNHL
ncbi:hypothetical protein C7T94_11680 [Pedobacter yulinensis]|uniref:DegT/DnrJ/EryC1/StrS aminotransferase family protein n=1 Tax=Pedobacter yulinensis TaxID=2126353 RepID=A0A2T3HLF1_9SPHI|nr:hypothetical protein [Pedobacter yulinensis]PST83246.1 hypothetical protein C7T94_11680 [Pedobacter yulinensis]